MTRLGRVRAVAFGLLDYLSGAEFTVALRDLQANVRQPYALARLLEHASSTVPAYADVGISLKDYPIIDKQVIRESSDLFRSSAFKTKQLHRVSTSGSTGTPLEWYQDRVKRRRVNAEVVYFSGNVGYAFGEQLTYLRALTSSGARKSRSLSAVQNQKVIDITDLGESRISRVLEEIRAQSSRHPVTVLAYASTWDAVARFANKNKQSRWDSHQLTGLISQSEALSPWTREVLAEFFSVPIVSRYSNAENGILAQENRIPGVFEVNQSNYLIEVLRIDSDSAAAPDELGRVVVTDLYNYAMPLIRYDTGDVAALADNPNSDKALGASVLTRLSGRRIDLIFDTCDNPVSPLAITNMFWDYPQIAQFQFVQEAFGTYRLLLNAERNRLDVFAIQDRLLRLLGSDAQLRIAWVNEVPVLASGKRKYIISHYSPQLDKD